MKPTKKQLDLFWLLVDQGYYYKQWGKPKTKQEASKMIGIQLDMKKKGRGHKRFYEPFTIEDF